MQLHGLDENQMKDDRENIKEKNKKNNTNENIKLMMNSKELNVNVPLATVDSDSEEFEVTALTEIKLNSPKKND